MKNTFYIIIATSFIIACSGDVEKHQPINPVDIQKQLLDANIKALALESKQIDNYVDSNKLNVIKTQTGLRYDIYTNIEGEEIKNEQIAVVKYTVNLLNGKECYSTQDKVEEFKVGKDYVESGLHEGITYMSEGDKAIIIIPSHLAHGLAGDFKKIPIRSTIVYNIELIAIK
jgi:FKBP-type peptidyl-prolyl cis-trans isomerase